MNLMQLIKSVLDNLFVEVEGHTPKDRYEAIEAALDSLSASYIGGVLLKANREPIDFSRASTRFAYIYKYTTAHADYVKQMFERSRILQSLVKRANLDLACIGGGPGSDFLGVLKYLIGHQKKPSVTCYQYDREDSWGESWGAITREIGLTFNAYTVWQLLDVTIPKTWNNKKNFLKADLFTFIYFFSEIYAFLPKAEDCLLYILGSAKQGSTVLFIDNNDRRGCFASEFDKLLAQSGFVVREQASDRMAFGVEEEKRDLEPYYSKFGWMKRKSDLCWRIATKG